MKKNVMMQFLLIALLLCAKSFAQQLPLASTSSNPIWYYIQVKGSDNGRESLTFTAENGEVHGRSLYDDINNPSMLASQLWRFEDAGDDWVFIINKATDKKITVAYDAARSIGYAGLTDDSSGKFMFVENTSTENYYTIQSEVPAIGASSSDVYLHQANTGGNRDYIIMLVGTDYGFGANSAFTFIIYNDYSIDYSNGSDEIWYNIISGKNDIGSLAIKDNSQNNSTSYALSVETLQEADPAQQWKIVKNAIGDEVNFVNRSTDNYIQSQSIVNGAYNMIELGLGSENGWMLSYLGMGQYAVSSVEEDGVTRYLHLSTKDKTPQEYESKKAKDSDFAWLFRKIPSETTASIPVKNTIKIEVIDRRISVNVENYTVTTINGVSVKKNIVLPIGIYLVTVNNRTIKVFVK